MFTGPSHIKARKSYTCTFCRRVIAKGEKHIKVDDLLPDVNDDIRWHHFRMYECCYKKFENKSNECFDSSWERLQEEIRLGVIAI